MSTIIEQVLDQKPIALIPARANSRRIPNKNFNMLGNRFLIEYTVNAALGSNIFSHIYISTDSDHKILGVVTCPDIVSLIKRPPEISGEYSNDIDWIKHAFDIIDHSRFRFYMILRPTNPFRTTETIKRAWVEYKVLIEELSKHELLCNHPKTYFSMKSVEPVKQYPQKMWEDKLEYFDDGRIRPFLYKDYGNNSMSKIFEFERQSCHFKNLYIQNGCIGIHDKEFLFWNLCHYCTFHVYPFYTQGYEGFDINTPDDWEFAEYILEKKTKRILDMIEN